MKRILALSCLVCASVANAQDIPECTDSVSQAFEYRPGGVGPFGGECVLVETRFNYEWNAEQGKCEVVSTTQNRFPIPCRDVPPL